MGLFAETKVKLAIASSVVEKCKPFGFRVDIGQHPEWKAVEGPTSRCAQKTVTPRTRA